MRNILKTIVFTGIMGVATATWGTQEIKIGDNVTLCAFIGIPEFFSLKDNKVYYSSTGFDGQYYLYPEAGEISLDVSLIDVSSNFQNGSCHRMSLAGSDSNILKPGDSKHIVDYESLSICFYVSVLSQNCIAAADYLTSLGVTDTKVDLSAVYRVKFTTTNLDQTTKVSKCFDFLVGGKCDLSTQKAPLEVIPEETIPDILTKNSAGQIVFAPPRPIGTLRLPRGHKCSEILVREIYKLIEGISNFFIQVLCRLNGTEPWITYIDNLTDKDVIELAVCVIGLNGNSEANPIDSAEGTDVSTLGVSGAFDWSTVIRGPIYITP